MPHMPLPSRSLLSPRWIGPFWAIARTAPTRRGSTYPLSGASSPCSTSSACAPATDHPTASVATQMQTHHRLRLARTRVFRSYESLCDSDNPGPDDVPEHEVQELLKFKTRCGRP